MARIKLELPETFHFTTYIDVRITDLNYGAHLGNDTVLALVHEARVQFLNHLGFTETDIDGVGILMSDAAVVYKSQAFYGERLTVKIAVSDFSKKSCDFFYRLSRTDGSAVALVKTGIVFYDYGLKKPVNVPEKFLINLEKVCISP